MVLAVGSVSNLDYLAPHIDLCHNSRFGNRTEEMKHFERVAERPNATEQIGIQQRRFKSCRAQQFYDLINATMQ